MLKQALSPQVKLVTGPHIAKLVVPQPALEPRIAPQAKILAKPISPQVVLRSPQKPLVNNTDLMRLKLEKNMIQNAGRDNTAAPTRVA